MLLAALLIKSAAGLVGLACFVLMLIYFFQNDEATIAIVCIVGIFFCGIGPLIAFVKGWMDGGMNQVMLIWTIAWAISLSTHFVIG